MKFEIGEYKTRNGSVAHVLVDWKAVGIAASNDLEGYITDDFGEKERISWYRNGKYFSVPHAKHEWDLIPPAMELKRYVFAIFESDDGCEMVFHRKNLEDAKEVRERMKEIGRRVSEIVTVVLTEDLGVGND